MLQMATTDPAKEVRESALAAIHRIKPEFLQDEAIVADRAEMA